MKFAISSLFFMLSAANIQEGMSNNLYQSSDLYYKVKNMCNTCLGVGSETCKDIPMECPEGSSCMTSSEEFGMYGKIYRSVSKRCTLDTNCTTSYHANSGQDVYVRVFQKCCSGNLCNTGYFEMPDIQPSKNGALCPVCNEFNTIAGCKATKKERCMGEDDLCIRFRGAMKPPGGVLVDFSAQGCMSKAACGSNYKELIGLEICKQIENTCYSPDVSALPQIEY